MRGRFAPSPTGDLHLGGARTALVAWLSARAAGSTFVLRMEDLDRPRVVAGAEARILEDLRALGLDWDEFFRQSERLDHYQRAVDKLVAGGRAFPCFCSRAELAASAPHGDEGPRYPGTCRDLNSAQIAERSRTRKPSLRLRVEPGAITWTDAVHGERCDDPSQQVGDFVIRRADGIFAYQLAVVVDDAEMGIEEVVRGDDLLASTARQIYLYRALGFREPRFAHVPLVLGPDGQRLSKRHGAIAVREYADALVKLAVSLNLCAPDEEVRARDLIARFSFDRLPKAPITI
jgi:glutamyl-tRNA synthetase